MCTSVGLFQWLQWPTWQSLLCLATNLTLEYEDTPKCLMLKCDRDEEFPLFVFLAFIFFPSFSHQFSLLKRTIYDMSLDWCCIYLFVIIWVFVDKLDHISVNMHDTFICPDSVHCNASQYHSVIGSSISVSILLTQFALLLSSTVSHTRLQSLLLRWPASSLILLIFFFFF